MDKNFVVLAASEASIESLLTELHIEKGHKLYEPAAAIFEASLKVARPTALYAPFTPEITDEVVLINGVAFKEPFVHEMLSDSVIVVPYVATCGTEIDEWTNQFTNIMDQYIADAVKESLLKAVREKMLAEVQEKYFDEKKSISRLNPGSLNQWPISGQTPLFKVLGGVTDDIGVILKESLLMIPVKSVSGIIFQTETPFHNCQLCPRLNCPGRSAPYQ